MAVFGIRGKDRGTEVRARTGAEVGAKINQEWEYKVRTESRE